MTENEKEEVGEKADEKLLILPLGEESKKITQVISNDTARQIIELLADASLSASDIAERLGVPLTTIVYNLENLENVGLVKVERIKYSEKGRQVKIYAPVRKLIVVVPEKTDRKSVADVIRKYMGVLLTAVFASSLIEFLVGGRSARFMQQAAEKTMPGISGSMPEDMPAAVLNETLRSSELYKGVAPTPGGAAESVTPAATSPAVAVPPQADALNASQAPTPVVDTVEGTRAVLANLADTIAAHPGLLFLLGCLFIIAVLVLLEYRKRR